MSKARDLANASTALNAVSPTELSYLDGVTSAVQTQIDSKLATTTAASTYEPALPTQSGQSGKFLKTNGTSKTWETVSSYALPSMTGKAGKYLTTDGTVESWAAAAQSVETYSISTTRKWLDTGFSKAGYYAISLSANTGTIFFYNSSNILTQAVDLTTATSTVQITSDFARLEAVSYGGSADLAMVPALPKVTTAKNGTLTLDFITGSGNYGAGTGTATGGTSGYISGQYAHVMVVGGGGGGGGYTMVNYPPYYYTGGGGGGGVAYNNAAFALTGTYSLTVGTGGLDNAGNGNSASSGPAGNASTGFGLTANGGGGGEPGGGAFGASGTPVIGNTNIYAPATYGKIGLGAGAPKTDPNVGGPWAQRGQNGVILVLRWTP